MDFRELLKKYIKYTRELVDPEQFSSLFLKKFDADERSELIELEDEINDEANLEYFLDESLE